MHIKYYLQRYNGKCSLKVQYNFTAELLGGLAIGVGFLYDAEKQSFSFIRNYLFKNMKQFDNEPSEKGIFL